MLAGVASAVGRTVMSSTARQPNLPAQPPWGDGFLELSLSTLWYSRSWSDVSDDELVLLFPYLDQSDDPEFGVAARIRHAFFRRLRASMIILDEGGKQRTLDLIAKTSSISSIISDKNFSDIALQIPTLEERAIAGRFASQNSTNWKYEIAVLASINRTLLKIRSGGAQTDSPELTDALNRSIHTGLNAAYVYPAYAFAHELFATGAWLGIVLRGRAALMPEFIARVLNESLVRPHGADPASDVLRFNAERAGGVTYFLQHARKALEFGHPIVVKPAPAALRSE
jgi:hypothetical protein